MGRNEKSHRLGGSWIIEDCVAQPGVPRKPDFGLWGKGTLGGVVKLCFQLLRDYFVPTHVKRRCEQQKHRLSTKY